MIADCELRGVLLGLALQRRSTVAALALMTNTAQAALGIIAMHHRGMHWADGAATEPARYLVGQTTPPDKAPNIAGHSVDSAAKTSRILDMA